MIHTFSRSALLVALMMVGCSNPAADKPVAIVSDPKPEADAVEAIAVNGNAAEPTDANPTGEALPITPDRSKIDFVGSKLTGSHEGGFKEFTGFVVLSPEGDEVQKLQTTIDMDSTWTDNDKLTSHLKTEDFFGVATYPEASFVSTEILPEKGEDGASHSITGNLTLHGVTKSITFPATLTVTDDEATVASEFVINRKDFGIEYSGKPDDLIRDEVVIRLDVHAVR